ncbi:phosphate acyltransferase PlsX [Ruminococcaceae bacterium OttesenSCG-928-O06]|nr:phosphate acyltransferase PlsX [Ruminococcaceae bacterium OttesenSCG-928-O06]
MRIIIDAMGGDKAPEAPLLGAAEAIKEYGVEITAVGNEAAIAAVMQKNNIPAGTFAIVHAPDVIDMEEDATDILRKKPDSSLAVAMRLLAEGAGDALVSAGNTGALLVGATMIVKRIKGIKRAAIGMLLPGRPTPWLLIDCGANVECRPEQLVQFGAMGSAYMQKVQGIASPRVGLVNNGTEESKGTALQQAAYPLLQQSGLDFIGNLEARHAPEGVADVIVTDGFTGNAMLKMLEGAARLFTGMLKEMFYSSTKTKLAALLSKGALDDFRKQLDYTEYGGAPLLGVQKPVIKAHGSSNGNAVKNAIRQATLCVENDLPGTIAAWLKQYKAAQTETDGDDE